MKIEINKDEYINLIMGLQCYKNTLRDDLKNKAHYLYGYDNKISQKTIDEMNKAISDIGLLMDKIIKQNKEEKNV